MSLLKKIAFVLFISVSLSACVYQNGRYAALSDKPITLYTLTGPKWRVADNITSRDSKHSFLIVSSESLPTIERAVSNILDENMGDYVANAEVKYRAFHILWIYHYAAWEVKGDVVRVYQ